MMSKMAGRVALLATAIVIGLLLSACLSPASTVCDDGRVCPANTRCDTVRHQCILPGCGDGVRSASEKCEGTDLGGDTCESLGYYGQTTGLACTEACGFDTSGCTGRCGDGKINGPHEQCDGAPPEGKTCVDYGYERGFLGCTERCEVSTDDCASVSWPPVLSANGNRFWDVWGSSSKDIYAVGESSRGAPPAPPAPPAGVIFHFDGSRWTPLTTIPPSGVREVRGSAANDVWALGPAKLLHWDGSAWSTLIPMEYHPGGPNTYDLSESTLESVAGGGTDCFVVTAQMNQDQQENDRIYHWDGRALAPFASPATPSQVGGGGIEFIPPFLGPARLWQVGPDVYLTAPSVSGSIFQRVAADWVPLAIGNAGDQFNGVWGIAGDLYALGKQGLYHRSGAGEWTKVPDAPGGELVQGTTANDIFIVSKRRVGDSDNGSAIKHWDGVAWSTVYEGVGVDAIWESELGELYVASPAGISRWARSWTSVVDVDVGATSMWGTNEDVYLLVGTSEGGMEPDGPLPDKSKYGLWHASKERPSEWLGELPPGIGPASTFGSTPLWGTSARDI
jgi:hypothetical protein